MPTNEYTHIHFFIVLLVLGESIFRLKALNGFLITMKVTGSRQMTQNLADVFKLSDTFADAKGPLQSFRLMSDCISWRFLVNSSTLHVGSTLKTEA